MLPYALSTAKQGWLISLAAAVIQPLAMSTMRVSAHALPHQTQPTTITTTIVRNLLIVVDQQFVCQLISIQRHVTLSQRMLAKLVYE